MIINILSRHEIVMGQGLLCNVWFKERQNEDCMVQGRYIEVERDKEGVGDWKMPPM
jgi:hypothetical protein